ncbi:MAG: DUF1015 domain-containing protein [Firmicutes bacterium]|nr:DUF1015 domain-containing protein [Bacillota bacterium]
MAIFKPFKALRPDKKYADKTLCQPYDIVTQTEAKVICEKNPESFMQIIRGDQAFPASEKYSDAVYQHSLAQLIAFEEKGIMIQDTAPSYYIYSQTLAGRTQTGIVGCCSVDDYENGVIKRHEFTRPEKEQDRIRHFDVCNANTEPVFLIFKNNLSIKALTETIVSGSNPAYDVSDDADVRHRLWAVADSSLVAEFDRLFTQMPALYIADGHHRTASAAKVAHKRRADHPDYDGTEEFNRFMAVAFDQDQLHVMDYNRLISDLNGLTKEDFLEKLQKDFDVILSGPDDILPQKKGDFTMYLDNNWYHLTLIAELAEDEIKHPTHSLDVSVLQNKVLEPLLGIADPRTDNRIGFSGGIKGPSELKKMVDSGQYAVAFAVYPVSVDDIIKVADAGMVMPPKSTWFEPKLGSGWFVHKI